MSTYLPTHLPPQVSYKSHGAMASLSAEGPTLIFAYDWRVRELAEAMKLSMAWPRATHSPRIPHALSAECTI